MLINPTQAGGGGGGGGEKVQNGPLPVFPLQLLQTQESDPETSEFLFGLFYYTGVKLQGHT